MVNSECGDSDDPFVRIGPPSPFETSFTAKVFLNVSSSSDSESLGFRPSVIDLTISGEDSVNKPESVIRTGQTEGKSMGIGADLGSPRVSSSESSPSSLDTSSSSSFDVFSKCFSTSHRMRGENSEGGVPSVNRGQDESPPKYLDRYVPLRVIHPPTPYELPDSDRVIPDESQIAAMLTSLRSLDPTISREDAINLIQANWASCHLNAPGSSLRSDPCSTSSSRSPDMARTGRGSRQHRSNRGRGTPPPESGKAGPMLKGWDKIRDVGSLLWAHPDVLSAESRIRMESEIDNIQEALQLFHQPIHQDSEEEDEIVAEEVDGGADLDPFSISSRCG